MVSEISHDELASAIKQAAITIGKKALLNFFEKSIVEWAAGKALGKLVTSLWFLANPLVGFIIDRLLVYLVQQTEFGLFFWYIDTRVSNQGRDFASAAIENRKAQASGTDMEKANAEKRLRDTFYQFASWRS